MKQELNTYLKHTIVFFCTLVVIISCQKDNGLLLEEQELETNNQTTSNQSHLRLEDLVSVVDFVNKETNNTRQVLIGKNSIKKAKQDYRNSEISAKMESSFGYIDTSNALAVESENVISYTFKVVTKNLTHFINYIVVEDKATLNKYSYFMKYMPTTNWTQNKLPLSVFSGTINYYNENETLQTTLTLQNGYIIDFGDTEIPCPEIVFNPIDAANESSGNESSSNGGGGTINNEEGTSLNWNPWESWWTGWVSYGGGGGGGDETTGDQEIEGTGGMCCSTCETEPGVKCSHEHHYYSNKQQQYYSNNSKTAQINLKSTPTVNNPCVHTGVIAFFIGQLGFNQEQLDWLTNIENENTYVSIVDYLNTYNYSTEVVDFAIVAINALMNDEIESFEDFLIILELEQDYKGQMSVSELNIFNSMSRKNQLSYLANAQFATWKSEELFPNSLYNGKGDAFRHAYWNAANVNDLGLILTESLTTAHEDKPSSYLYDSKEKNMDLYNNKIGRGRWNFPLDGFSSLQESILNAINNGDLRYLNNLDINGQATSTSILIPTNL